jgi:deoxyribonuclease-4
VHVSISGSLDLAFDRALEIGATTFQIFTRNPNQWKFKPIPKESAEAFREKRRRSGFKEIVAHMPYLPNLASSDHMIQKESRASLDEEVLRCDSLGISYLVVHLGSHMGAGTMQGVRNISRAVNEALARSSGNTMVLLENMAGQKNSVGSRFEEIKLILDMVKSGKRVGVCFDTCHAFASGFGLTGRESVNETMSLFDSCIGYDRLKVVHLNDSKGELGSNLDRHEDIGRGKIGSRGMKAILGYRGMTERPLILETPFEDTAAMKRSLATVRRLIA